MGLKSSAWCPYKKRRVIQHRETEEKLSGYSGLEMWLVQTEMCIKCEINAHWISKT